MPTMRARQRRKARSTGVASMISEPPSSEFERRVIVRLQRRKQPAPRIEMDDLEIRVALYGGLSVCL
jgi:hypothetical protein